MLCAVRCVLSGAAIFGRTYRDPAAFKFIEGMVMKKVLSMLLLSIALVSFSTFAQADTIHKKTDVESMMKIMASGRVYR